MTWYFNESLSGERIKRHNLMARASKCLEYELVIDLMLREPWSDPLEVAREAGPYLKHIARYDRPKAQLLREALLVKARSLAGEI